MADLAELCAQRVAAKAAEDRAVAERRRIDSDIAELLKDPAKTEGTVYQKPEGYKVSVEYGVTRKVDTAALQLAWTKLPKAVQDSIKWKAELSTTEFRKLAPEDSLELSRFIESKASTPSVKVEKVEAK